MCKKVKNILEIGTVLCISLPIKRIVESQLNNRRRGKTERKWFKRKRQKFKLLFLLTRNVAFVLLLANAVNIAATIKVSVVYLQCSLTC